MSKRDPYAFDWERWRQLHMVTPSHATGYVDAAKVERDLYGEAWVRARWYTRHGVT